MTYLLHVALLALGIWLIGRKQPDAVLFYIGMVLKLAAGILLGLIFKNYYWGGDTFAYYHAASALADSTFLEWWHMLGQAEVGYFVNQPRAILFTKIVSGFIRVTGGDYWVVACYFSYISFLAFWFFYRQIKTTLPNLKWPVVIGFLLVPSTIFWSSGIMKETITNAAVVYICAFALKVFYRKKIYLLEILLTALAITLLYEIKYYILIALLPVVLYAWFDQKAHRNGLHKSIRAVVYGVIILGTLLFAPTVNPNLNLRHMPEIIHRNQEEAFEPTPDASSIDLRIQPTWPSLLGSLPHALVVGLYGPSIFDKGSVWSWIPKLENLLLVLLSLYSLTILWQQRLFSPDILVIASLIFIFSLAIALPLAAPNFGALVRYKSVITPFLFTLLTILPCWQYQSREQNR